MKNWKKNLLITLIADSAVMYAVIKVTGATLAQIILVSLFVGVVVFLGLVGISPDAETDGRSFPKPSGFDKSFE